jgi:glycosyltransferase involved in cell wall biosynthesis
LVDLIAKMEFLLSRPEVVQSYRMKAAARVEKEYSWEAITLKYEELFKSLVEGTEYPSSETDPSA